MSQIVPAGALRERLAVLDGWRAISILLVVAAHMLPLGTKRFSLNGTVAPMGMALFFTLSGFLITQQLEQRKNVVAFLIRRTFRILPLAYLAILGVAWFEHLSTAHVLANLGFVQNYEHRLLIQDLSHLWSLCVEMHFYLFAALLIWVAPARGLMILPLVWLVFFCIRFASHPSGTIETHLRVDEILSGCMLALVHLGKFGDRPRQVIGRLPFWLLAVVLFAASWQSEWPGGILRGLAASCLVGQTLFAREPARYAWLEGKALHYLAEISYALYVIHPLMMIGWMGTGSTVVRYGKRMVGLVLAFGAAHLSTFYYERRFMAWGKALCDGIEQRPQPPERQLDAAA